MSVRVFDCRGRGTEEIGRIGAPKNGTMKRLCVMVRENLPLRYVLQVCDVDEKNELDPRIGLLFSPEDLQSLFGILKRHLGQ